MPYSNLVINPNAGSVPSFGGLDASQWSHSNSVQNSNNTSSSQGAFGGMMNNLISGGLGAVGGLLTTGLNAIFAKKAAQRQFKYNKQLMQFQNELQRDMLVDEMALKMRGYKNAGLSTASLAGNFSNNTAVPGTSVSAPQASSSDFSKLGDIFNVARQVKLQEAAIESQIDLNHAQAQGVLANARKANAEAAPIEQYGMQTAASTLQNIDQNTKTQLAQEEKMWTDAYNGIRLTDAQIRQIDGQLDIAYKTLPSQLQVLAAQVYELHARGVLSYADAAEAYQSIQESAKRIEKMEVDMGLTSAQTAVAWATKSLIEKQKETEGWKSLEAKKNAQILQLQYDIAKSMGMGYYHFNNVMNAINPVAWVMAAVGLNRAIPGSRGTQIGFK